MATTTSTEQWRWQDGTENSDYMHGAAMGPDGSFVLAAKTFGDWSITNQGEDDFAIVKLDNNGSLLWKWQNGSSREDDLNGVGIAQDGSVIVGGITNGSYGRASEGGLDFVALKLDSNGNVEWAWQDGTDEDDGCKAVAVGEEGSVILAGYTCGNWTTTQVGVCDVLVVKLDLNGTVMWTWQNGTENGDYAESAVIQEDGSVLIVLETDGDWDGANIGSDDFAAVKLGANGTEIWRWQGTIPLSPLDIWTPGQPRYFTEKQYPAITTPTADGILICEGLGGGNGTAYIKTMDGTADNDYMETAAATMNGTFVLAGSTYGDWNGSNAGDRDFAALKLDADGNLVWKWQGGTPEEDHFNAAVALEGGSTILAGYTYGSWYGENAGDEGTRDFAAVKLDANGIVEWRWQDGTVEDDDIRAAASNGNNQVFMAGTTGGSWTEGYVDSQDFAAVFLEVEATRAPNPSPTASSPTRVFTHAPTASSSVRAPESLPTTLSPEHVPTPSPTVSGPVHSSTHPPTTWSAVRASTPSPTTLSSTEVPVGSESTSTSMAVVVGAAMGLAAAAVIIALALCLRKRIVKQNVVESPLPRQVQPSQIPPPAGGRYFLRPSQRYADVIPLPEQNDNDTASVPDERGLVRASSNVEESKVTDHVMTTSMIEITAPQAEVSPGLPPPYDPRVDPGYCKADITRTTKAVSSQRSASSAWDEVSSHNERLSIAEAVLETAEAVARSTNVPGVTGAISLISVLVKLVAEHQNSDDAAKWWLAWCRSVVMLLEQTSEAFGKGEVDGTIRAEERSLLEEIHDCVSNLIGIIRTYETKSKIPELFASPLLKLRQEEAKAVVGYVVSRLSGLGSDSTAQAITESQRAKNQRRLQHDLEIPEDQVGLTDMLLGKGGFTNVFLTDYRGINAAMKVVQIDREQRRSTAQDDGVLAYEENMARPRDGQERQRNLFNRELEAMTRLKSSHTVHVYGAITSRVDRLVLVMELMVGGDLRALIRRTDGPLLQGRARGVMKDICSGMAFLHGKGAIHGNLKSSNVLLDHSGLAKVTDFGTAKWIQLGASAGSGSACVGTTAITSAHMSIPWTAPEVLDSEKASFESDAYSFGITAWEIASRQMPWAGVDARSIFRRVVLAGDRPPMPREVTAEIADMIRLCWAEDPSARPKFSEVLSTMNSWEMSNS